MRVFCIKYPYRDVKRNVYVKALDEEDAEYIRQQIGSNGFVDGELIESIALYPNGEIERTVHGRYADEDRDKEEPSH